MICQNASSIEKEEISPEQAINQNNELLKEGLVHFLNQNYIKAGENFESYLRVASEDKLILNAYADILFELKEYAKSIPFYKHLIKSNQNVFRNLLKLERCYLFNGNFKMVIECLEILYIKRTDFIFLIQKYMKYKNQGMLKEALIHIDDIITLHPFYKFLFYEKIKLLKLLNPESIEMQSCNKILEEFKAEESEFSNKIFQAFELISEMQLEKGEKLLNELISNANGNKQKAFQSRLCLLISLLINNSNFIKETNLLDELANTEEQMELKFHFLLIKGNLLMKANKYDAAIKVFEQILNIDKTFILAIEGKILCLFKKNEVTEFQNIAIYLSTSLLPGDKISLTAFLAECIDISKKNLFLKNNIESDKMSNNVNLDTEFENEINLLYFNNEKFEEADQAELTEITSKVGMINDFGDMNIDDMKYFKIILEKFESLKNSKLYKPALSLINQLILRYKTKTDLIKKKIMLLKEMKNYQEIINCCDDILAQKPDDKETYIEKITSLKILEKLPDLIKCYESYLIKFPVDMEILKQMIYYLEKLKKLDQALPYYERMMNKDPKNELLAHSYVENLFKLERYQHVLTFLNEKSIIFSGKSWLHFSKINAFLEGFELTNNESFLDDISEETSNIPPNEEDWLEVILKDLYVTKGIYLIPNYILTTKYGTNLLSNEFRQIFCLNKRFAFLEITFQETLRYYNSYIMNFPEDYKSYKFRLNYLLNLKNIQERKDLILRYFDLLINTFLYVPEFHFKKIDFLFFLNSSDYEIIIKCFDELIEKFPGDIQVYLEKLKFLQNNFYSNEEILSCYDQILNAFPTNIQIYKEKIELLKKNKNYKEIVSTYDKMLENYPDDFNLYKSKIFYLNLSGETEQIKKTFKQYKMMKRKINKNNFEEEDLKKKDSDKLSKLEKEQILIQELQIIEDFLISKHTVKRKVYISEGNFGKVYLGCMRKDFFNKNITEVAIKDINISTTEKNDLIKLIKEFNHELEMMEICNNPYLIKCYGYTLQENIISFVMEICSGRSLDSYFQYPDKKILDYKLNCSQKLKILLDVAEGIKFLHRSNPPIVHKDIKSLNVLLKQKIENEDSFVEAKIADYGISEFLHIPKEGEKNFKIAGSINWMAPELFNNEFASFKSDIYAYGVLMWEIFAERIPYFDVLNEDGEKLTDTNITFQVQIFDLRPDVDQLLPHTPKEIKELMVKCWNVEKNLRPEIEEVIEVITALEIKG